MTLPADGEYWPPTRWSTSLAALARYDAWYTDDLEALQYLYATTNLQQATSVWSQVRRFFWGSPTPQTTTERPVKMHVPVAATIARLGAQVLFSELPGVQFGDGDHDQDDQGLTGPQGKTVEERLVELLDDDAHAALIEADEYRNAHGGVFVKVAWNRDVADGPFLDVIATDAAVPTFTNGRLRSVIFWTQLASIDGDKNTYRLLEEHTVGRIEFALYQSRSSKTIGMRVPLTGHPDTEYLAAMLDDDSGITTGSTLLTAVYVPRSRPNGRLRRDPVARDLGRSAYDGVEDLFDRIDEAYTSWIRDIRLGRARIVVPKGFLTIPGPGKGAVFDSDQEIFTPVGEQVGSLNVGTGTGSVESFITMFQPNIRFKEHLETVTHLIAKAYQACGYSPQTFGDAGEVAVTATEVTARQSLTSLTRATGVMYWKPQLKKLYAALLDVDRHVFAGPGRGEALPNIEWSDSETIAPEVQARTLQALVLAEAVSLYTRVGMLHEDWDADQIDAEVDRIRNDLSMLPDPTMAHLWAAQADNGSITGGADFKSATGVVVDPTTDQKVKQQDTILSRADAKANNAAGQPST